MEMNKDIEKVIETIRKMLRMAADTSSPNEAAIAAVRARKLMDKYQIDLSDLREHNGFGFGYVDKSYRFVPMWKSTLAVALAKNNDCKVSYHSEWKKSNSSYSKRIMFQGFESDVAVATAMYDYLVGAVERLCKNYMNDAGYTKYVASIGDAYKKGASLTLAKRLNEMTASRTEELRTHSGTSLVVYKMAQVEAEFGKAKYKNVSLSTRGGGDDAYSANRQGVQDGANISLNAQVKSGSVAGYLTNAQ